MKLQELLHKINDLKAELDSLKPLKAEDQQRLDKKFRLEWNYNSNHIEGNTLTYGQTELLLIFDKTTGDHDMREYEEMKAHDVAIKLIAEYAKDPNRVLTESEVRELNKIILVRPFWGNAQTPDGQPTRKLIQPGEYKKEPNSVRLQNGEMFHYASPEETPARMQELMSWFNKVSLEKRMHPVEIAAHLHYKFVLIHPFDDSNGRTSRLLMNYVLLLNGFPPVIIKTADKKGYLNALNNADVGDLNAFVEYIASELTWSLDVSLKAAKGHSIEEETDIDKEIEVLKKVEKSKQKSVPKTFELVEKLNKETILPCFERLIIEQSKFNELFVLNEFSINYNSSGEIRVIPEQVHDISSGLMNMIKNLKQSYAQNPQYFSNYPLTVIFQAKHLELMSRPKEYLVCIVQVSFNLKSLFYEISVNDVSALTKSYSDSISEQEIRTIVNKASRFVLDRIQGLKP